MGVAGQAAERYIAVLRCIFDCILCEVAQDLASLEDAVEKVSFPEKVYVPNPENHKMYMQIYEKLNRQIYPALKTFNEAVTEMQADLFD